MKQILFFIILSLSACSTKTLSHKEHFIDAINRGDFEQAAEELYLVTDWDVDFYLEPDSIVSFLQAVDTANIPMPTRDSLYAYVTTELGIVGDAFFETDDFESAIDIYMQQKTWCEKYLGVDNLHYAGVMYNLGYYYEEIDSNSLAEKYYLASLDTYKSTMMVHHPHYAIIKNALGCIYSHMGNYEQGEVLLKEVLEFDKEKYGLFHINYAISLNNLGGFYMDHSEYTEAMKYFMMAKDVFSNSMLFLNINYISLLNNIGDLYLYLENLEIAEEYYLKAMRMCKITLQKSNFEYTYSLNNLKQIYTLKNEHQKALKYSLKILKTNKKHLGTSHERYINSLVDVGCQYIELRMYSDAQKYFTDALERKEQLGDTIDHSYITIIGNLGYTYYKSGDIDLAKINFLKAVEQCELKSHMSHFDYGNYSYHLGEIFANQSEYLAAKNFYLKALDVFIVTLGVHHPQTVTCLKIIGDMYTFLNDYKSAEQYYLSVIDNIQLIHDGSHLFLADLFSKLGRLYWDILDYKQAETYYLKAWEILKGFRTNTECIIGIINLLQDISDLYLEIGEYHHSEKYLLEATELSRAHEIDSINWNLLCKLGRFYLKMNDFDSAAKYYIESAKKSQELENSSIESINFFNEVGWVFQKLENYEYALKCFEKVLKIADSRETISTEEHASYLNNLGLLYCDMEEYDKAENIFHESLMKDKSATCLYNLANVYFQKKQYSDAIKYYLEALEITEYLELRAECLSGLVYCCIQINDFKLIEENIVAAEHIYRNIFTSSGLELSENQRNKLWDNYNFYYEYIYPIYAYNFYSLKPSISTFAYDNELFVKGLLLNSSESVKRSILESNDTTLISQWNELTTKKQQIQVLQEKEPQSDYLKQIQEEAERLEKQITRSSAAYRENQAMWQITWDSVQNHLSSNDVAIEYFSAPLSEDSTMYCALLLRHDSQYPELIPLFEEKEVSSYLSTSKGNITNQTYDYYANGETISQLVWSKILPYINEGETIYFAPSGLLHQLAIEYLPYDENSTMSDVYNMVRLSSTREIVLNKQNTEYTTATIYGGIAYDLEEDVLLAESENYATENLLASRSIENDTLNRGNVKYLPGTKKEAESINLLLKQNNISAKLYTTAKANEESFKALSGKHRNILHIGTHGFTWTDSVAKKQDYFTQCMQLQALDGSNRFTTPTIDPLNRCGLLFAGANIALQGNSKNLPEGVQDGILTAKEISLMDLRDANLVVLSACETAKGDITSEGVFGLQRAFKMAGVQTIIMSLWKVNDQATQLLMTEFYNNWIGKHQSKRESFRNAQNTVRNKYEEPEYWAGFIMLD
ncbi:MAG: tetratricopeptide repeat protein [Paludibacteraceae bacterium]|nr:tetratricopeptide repeat protein [Paludibacteraceae bacterium]